LAVIVAAGGATPAARSAAASAFVRVNQVGYPSGSPKRAYLMATADESGATFSVQTTSGTTVFMAPVGPSLGSWSRTYKFVYPLDFDSVAAAGTYRITVGVPVAASEVRNVFQSLTAPASSNATK